MRKKRRTFSKLAVRIGLAGALAFGAVVTGLLASRRGRHLLREAWQGRKRTRLEDRVLDAIWGDRVLTRRAIDVREIADGVIELTGRVRAPDEIERAVRLAEGVGGITRVLTSLEVEPAPGRPSSRERPAPGPAATPGATAPHTPTSSR